MSRLIRVLLATLLLSSPALGQALFENAPQLDYSVPLDEEQVAVVFGESPDDWTRDYPHSRRDEIRETVEVILIECRVAGHITEEDEKAGNELMAWFNSRKVRRTVFHRASPVAHRYLMNRSLELRAELEKVGGERTKKGKALIEEANLEALPPQLVLQDGVFLVSLYEHVKSRCGDEDITEIPEPNPTGKRVRLN